jgi:hypothetical protein
MGKMKQMKNDEKYFIVLTDDLGTYGDAHGMTKDRAESLLNDGFRSDEVKQISIIKGIIIEPAFDRISLK